MGSNLLASHAGIGMTSALLQKHLEQVDGKSGVMGAVGLRRPGGIYGSRVSLEQGPSYFCLFRAPPAAYRSFWARVESELQLLAYATATATPD